MSIISVIFVNDSCVPCSTSYSLHLIQIWKIEAAQISTIGYLVKGVFQEVEDSQFYFQDYFPFFPQENLKDEDNIINQINKNCYFLGGRLQNVGSP